MTSPPPAAPLPPPPAQVYPAPTPPPRKPGTNGFAVAALIFGLLGLLPLSIIFGIVALVQIRRQPQAGKVIAIIGMVVPTVALVVSVAAAIAVEFSKSDSTPAADNGQVSVNEIRIGDCLNGLAEGRSIENLPVVPCAEPHDGEVFASFAISGAAFPGDAAVTSQAEKGCVERLRSYAPKAAEDQNTQLYYLHPTAASWLTGDREITCVALSATGKTTGSMFD